MSSWVTRFFIIKLFFALFFSAPSFAVNSLSHLKNLASDPKFLVLQVRGGLGNRVGVLASAYAAARISGRVLVLDWRIGHGNGSTELMEMPAKFEELFENEIAKLGVLKDGKLFVDWQVSPTKEALKELEDYLKGKCNFCRFLCGKKSNIFFFDMRFVNYKMPGLFKAILNSKEEIVYLHHGTRDFVGEILDHDAFSPEIKKELLKYYLEFYRLLTPVKQVRDVVNHYIAAHFPKDTFVIGVHYRSFSAQVGDVALSKMFKDHGFSNYDSFKEAMNNVVRGAKSQGKKLKFFLATDSDKIKADFARDFSGKIISFDHKTGISRDNLETQLGGLVDFYLLAGCATIYGTTRSSFSDQASVMTLSGIKGSIGPKIYESHGWNEGTSGSKFYQEKTRVGVKPIWRE